MAGQNPSGRDVAEGIATVVADIRAEKVAMPGDRTRRDSALVRLLFEDAVKKQPVVDVTAIYEGLGDRAERTGVNLYDSFPSVVSPWPHAMIGYVNKHGNAIVMQTRCGPWVASRRWDTPNDVDWGRCRWLVEAAIWVGGFSEGRTAKTTGPVWMLHHAVYDDGAPADLRWVDLVHHDGRYEEYWQMSAAVLNGAFNFLSCSNVETVEPERPRPVRRRLERTGVQVQTIVVRPIGKRTRSANTGRAADDLDVPLSSVRGSFGHYGPRYGAGLLFGKYEGKFWRPAHARGRGEGDGQKDYVLQPNTPS